MLDKDHYLPVNGFQARNGEMLLKRIKCCKSIHDSKDVKEGPVEGSWLIQNFSY